MLDSPRILRLAGIGAILLIVMFFSAIRMIADYRSGRDGFRLNLRFNYIGDLVDGASVLLSGGKKIGFVEKIYQKELKTYVRVFIEGELKNKIPKNYSTQFAIFSTSITGQKYLNLQLQPPKPGEVFLKNEDEWFGLEPASLDTLLLGLSSWFEERKDNPEKVFDDITAKFQQFMLQIKQIQNENRSDVEATLEQTALITGDISVELDKLLKDLKIITDNYSEISTKNTKNIEFLQTGLVKIVNQLNTLFIGLDKGKGTAGQFMRNPELLKNADEALKLATEFFSCITNNPLVFLNQTLSCDKK